MFLLTRLWSGKGKTTMFCGLRHLVVICVLKLLFTVVSFMKISFHTWPNAEKNMHKQKEQTGPMEWKETKQCFKRNDMKHDVKDHFNHRSTNKPPRSSWSLSKPSGSIRIGNHGSLNKQIFKIRGQHWRRTQSKNLVAVEMHPPVNRKKPSSPSE